MESTVNLCTNPSFETDDTGWSLIAGTSMTVVDDSTAPSGTKVLKCVATTGAVMTITGVVTDNLEAGKTYTVSVYAKDNPSNSFLYVYHDGNQMETFFLTTSWTRYSYTFTATADLPLEFRTSASNSDSELYVDAIMVTEGATLHDYFDGNSGRNVHNHYQWNGAINLSSSRHTYTEHVPDLTRLQSYSETPAFINRDAHEDGFTISGSVVAGVNVRTHVMELPFVPLIADVQFLGRSDVGFWWGDNEFDPRPNDGWFKEGSVWARGDSGFLYSNEGTQWLLGYDLTGNILTINAVCVQQFDETLTLTPELVQVKVTDYASA